MSVIDTSRAANPNERVCERGMSADLVCLIFWMILVPLVMAAIALGLTFFNTAT